MTGFKLDHDGLGQVLMSESVQAAVDAKAVEVAGGINAQLPDDGDGAAEAERYDFQPRGRTSDRAAATVVVKRADARSRQARDGIVTRAAAQAGLEVTEDSGA